MTQPHNRREHRHREHRHIEVPPYDRSGHTLLPMLVGGLVLIVIGAIAVMTFV